MKNIILQAIQKQYLANRLATHDCYFLIANLKTFSLQKPIAKFFIKPSKHCFNDKINSFIKSEDDPILCAIAQELSARTDLFGECLCEQCLEIDKKVKGTFLAKTSPKKPTAFYLSLLQELYQKDFPAQKEQYRFLKKRIELLSDMRLYAAEVENFCELAASNNHVCNNLINWQKTTKEELYAEFITGCRLTSKLTKTEQQNFANFFSYCLFEKSLFVSSWNYLAIDKSSNAYFIDFDYVYYADHNLKNFAIKHITNNASPKMLEQLKLSRAIKFLQKYCKDIDIKKCFKPYLNTTYKEKKSNTKDLLHSLKFKDKHSCIKPSVQSLNPNNYQHLFASSSKEDAKKYWHRSMIILLGLAILIIFLYNFR